MHYPKISIVTQCFNRQDRIAETIESVLSQGYPNLEYIVIDDNSSDKSWEIIQRYKKDLAHCERLPGHRDNPAYATNYGFSRATGEVMTWLNSKNTLLPKSLFTVGQVFGEFSQVEWLTAMGTLIDEKSQIVAVIPVRKDRYEHLVGGRANIQQESTFWRRSLWERTGAQVDESRVAIDVTLWSTKFFPNTKLYHLNTLIGAYRKTADSYSGNRRERFYQDIADARDELWRLVDGRTRAYARLYSVVRWGKPLLRNIPDRVYEKIPVLNEFCHEAIAFENLGNSTLKMYKRNPFRTIFPW